MTDYVAVQKASVRVGPGGFPSCELTHRDDAQTGTLVRHAPGDSGQGPGAQGLDRAGIWWRPANVRDQREPAERKSTATTQVIDLVFRSIDHEAFMPDGRDPESRGA